MQTSRRPHLLLLAAITLVLASCGSGDDGAATTTEAPATSTTAPDAADPGAGDIDDAVLGRVASDICSAVGAWSNSISEAYDATPAALAEADDTESARGVVVDWMSSMSAHTETLVGELEAIDLGGADALETFVDDLAALFENLNGIIEDHEAQAAELSTSAPETFRTEVSDLVDEFNGALAAVPTVFDDLNASYPSDDLQAALAAACELDPLGDRDDPDLEG